MKYTLKFNVCNLLDIRTIYPHTETYCSNENIFGYVELFVTCGWNQQHLLNYLNVRNSMLIMEGRCACGSLSFTHTISTGPNHRSREHILIGGAKKNLFYHCSHCWIIHACIHKSKSELYCDKNKNSLIDNDCC